MKHLVAALALALTTLPLAAHAAPPSNDSVASPGKVGSLPAASFVNFQEATVSVGEDTSCVTSRTVWYSWRAKSAAPLTVQARDFRDGAPVGNVQVYRKARGALTPIACGAGAVTFTPDANTVYMFQIGDTGTIVDIYWNHGGARGGETSSDAVNVVAPPFPYAEYLSLGGLVSGDPDPTCGVMGTSEWFAYEADAARLVNVQMDALVPFYFQIYVVSGGSLVPVPGGCQATSAPGQSRTVPLSLLAGQQIYVQYGHNIDPTADQGSGIRFGFFSLGPVA